MLATIGGHLLTALQLAQLFQVQIVGVQGKARRDVIGIGVVPAAVGRRVVDGQHLYDLHARLLAPVHQTAQVAEVAHAEGVFTTQREHRHYHAGCPPHLLLHVEHAAIEHAHLTVLQFLADHTVVAFLPRQQFMRLVVYDHVLVFQGQPDGIHVD